ncbi:doublecortin domain-containing protein 2-like [Acanthaster planci]|uniref:Doublecortin domain-containing protein 2-like n=1 Tax=Acanthaster planci TaxID=133434 RepID=A0A8B7ZI48_ACAPL|nr:doublecortin domain-containing protein 2-like [Acanthaster planci]
MDEDQTNHTGMFPSIDQNVKERRAVKRIQPVGHSNIRVSAKCIKRQEGPKVVHAITTFAISLLTSVFRNGGDMSPAVRVLLHKNQMLSMVHILDHITSKVTLTSGAVRRLYHMSGKLVLDGSELENEQCYVAAGGEKFKKRGYNIQNLQQTSPRNKRVLPPVTRRPPPKAKPSPIREQQKPTHQPREPKPPPPKQEVPARRLPPKPAAQPEQKPKSRRPKPEKTAEQREAEAVFHHKPAIVKRSREKEEQPKESLDYEGKLSIILI